MEVVHIFLFLFHNISSFLPFYTAYCIFHITMCLVPARCLVFSSLPFLWQPNWPRPPWNQRLSHFYSFSSFQFLPTCVSWHLYRVALFTAGTPINVSPCNFTFKSDFSTLLDIWNQSYHELQTFVVFSSKEFDSGGLYLQKMTSFPGQSMMKKREFSSHKCRGVKYRLI